MLKIFPTPHRQSSKFGDEQKDDLIKYFANRPTRRRARTNSTTNSSALWTSDTSSLRARELAVASRKSPRPSHLNSTPKQSRFHELFNDKSGDDPAPKGISTLKSQLTTKPDHFYDGSDDWQNPSREDPDADNPYYGKELVDHTPEVWKKAIRSHRASLEAQSSLKVPKGSIYRSLSEGGRLFGSLGAKGSWPGGQRNRSSSKVSEKHHPTAPSPSSQLTSGQSDPPSSFTPAKNSIASRNAPIRLKQRLSLRRRALQPSSAPNIKGSWSRFPSHTKHIRSASAGESDNVIVRDFAGPEFLGGRRISKGGKSYQSITFRGRMRQGWHRLIRSRSTEFRVSGRGPRSSIAVGGPSQFPELQILTPTFPHTIKPMTQESQNELNRVFPNQQTSSSSSGDSNIDAGKWSELYHDCVELPDGKSSVHLGDLQSKLSLFNRPKSTHFPDLSESSSRLHQSAIDFERGPRG